MSHAHAQSPSHQGLSHAVSIISHPLGVTPCARSLQVFLAHSQSPSDSGGVAHTPTLTHTVFLTRSALHSGSSTLLEPPSGSRSLSHAQRHPLARSHRGDSHVPPARPAPGLAGPNPARGGGGGGAESSAFRTRPPARPRPRFLRAPARGPLPRGSQAPTGCSVARPPRPPGPLRPRPRHVTRRRIATARAASGQDAQFRAESAVAELLGPGAGVFAAASGISQPCSGVQCRRPHVFGCQSPGRP